jgi:hypothetical protein
LFLKELAMPDLEPDKIGNRERAMGAGGLCGGDPAIPPAGRAAAATINLAAWLLLVSE